MSEAQSEEQSEFEFTSWESLSRHLLHHGVHHEIFDSDNIRFTREHDGEVMQVFVQHAQRDSGGAWILFGIRFHPANPAVTATLTETGEPVGALCLIGDYLCYLHRLPLRGLRTSHVEQTIHALCAGARRIRTVLQSKAAAEPATQTPFAD